MYSNISEILLLYKTWEYYNKFDSAESLGVYYCCVKIPQCGYMEHGLKYIMFYIQKHIAPLAMCYNPPLVRDKPLGAPTLVKLSYFLVMSPSYGWGFDNPRVTPEMFLIVWLRQESKDTKVLMTECSQIIWNVIPHCIHICVNVSKCLHLDCL